jgi:hypothetical protein
MAVAMQQKDLRSDSWNHRGVSPVRMSISVAFHRRAIALSNSGISSSEIASITFSTVNTPALLLYAN